ncbi:unnamed protein product [Musa acuminata subsp. malaccensis]|uniref:protein-serine/threonine phosphatase n=1 Tax=Musa acuminata subsp. malaccensis TaxID=214687 RepID=A0A804L191_MUSAM|nr:PREDICTED: probable protein phosphatase 2C 57 [Musa acuminata subsp. malaccensis]CAG1854848.1 unnamed protein product [Musa acuminata subsp. malaccensis]
MEGSLGDGGGGAVGKNGERSDGRPPNPFAGAYRQSYDVALGGSPGVATLIRHGSLTKTEGLDVPVEDEKSNEDFETDFLPIVRSGAWADIGIRPTMEDAYVCCDNFIQEYGLKNSGGPNAFYGVFDGHGGKHAADFACSNLPRFLLEDEDFPGEIERAVASAFLQTDTAFAEACSVNSSLASGTTALAALVVGRSLVVANAGDCRAVLCRRGKAIDMSHDHKPDRSEERKRIEALGGFVCDDYLNGLLNVARAIGDWHVDGMKDRDGLGPLSAEPEVMTRRLTEEDEFLILGCDGFWDVFRSQNAVDLARRKLQEHNDPTTCCKELVDEALKRESSDNLAVVLVCFQTKPPPVMTAPRPRVRRSISGEGLRELQSFLDRLADGA